MRLDRDSLGIALYPGTTEGGYATTTIAVIGAGGTAGSRVVTRTQKPSQEKADEDPVREDQRYDLKTRWGTALAERLQRLARYSSQGLLSHADERRFQSLCEELDTLSDLIDRFELTRQVTDST